MATAVAEGEEAAVVGGAVLFVQAPSQILPHLYLLRLSLRLLLLLLRLLLLLQHKQLPHPCRQGQCGAPKRTGDKHLLRLHPEQQG